MKQETIKKLEGLKKTYNQRRLLEVVEECNKQLKADGIDNTIWYEAVSELSNKVESGETSISSIISEACFMAKDYERLHKIIKDEYKAPEQIALAKSLMSSPIFLLQVVYIHKHPKYKTLEGFIGKGYNKRFERAMGEDN